MYENRELFTISRMAKVLGVSESGYYKWLNRSFSGASPREKEEATLRAEIYALYLSSRGSFGRRKITKLLNEKRLNPVNHKRVGRIMHNEGWFSCTRKRYCSTTDSNHDNPIAENLIARDFETTRPNQKMVSDTTVIKTTEGNLYVAGILDLYGRMPVGFAMSKYNDTALVIAAFQDMITTRY